VHTSTLRERLKGEENMTGIKSGTSSHCVVDDIRGKKRKIHIPPPLETETELERGSRRFYEDFDRIGRIRAQRLIELDEVKHAQKMEERKIEHEAKLKEDFDWHAQKMKKAREEMELQREEMELQREKLKLQREQLEFERERQKFERDSKKSA
jgi:hypothetical protein